MAFKKTWFQQENEFVTRTLSMTLNVKCMRRNVIPRVGIRFL